MSDPSSPLSFGTGSTHPDDNHLAQEEDLRSQSQTDKTSQSHPETELYSRSPLAQSLLTFSHHPNCPAVPGFFDNVAEEDQPRRLASMPNTADYFVDNTGQPIVLVFPAQLDFEGKYSRTGTYFNLPTSVSQVSIL
jgi:hypothetical protein